MEFLTVGRRKLSAFVSFLETDSVQKPANLESFAFDVDYAVQFLFLSELAFDRNV